MKPIVLTLLLAFAAYYGWTHRASNDAATADLSAPQIQTLAASVKAEEVVMYSTTECPYCREAKGWLAQNGFAFTECNMGVERRCEAEFKAYGGNGTPFLVIRRGGKEHQMKDGFDSDEFLAALRGAPRRFVWNPTITIAGRSRPRWACGQAALGPVHMSTGQPLNCGSLP